MAVDLFELYRDAGALGCCLVTRGAIFLGGEPLVAVCRESGSDGEPTGEGPRHPNISVDITVGKAFRFEREITPREADRHEATLKAAEYVAKLEAEHSAALSETRRVQGLLKLLEEADTGSLAPSGGRMKRALARLLGREK